MLLFSLHGKTGPVSTDHQNLPGGSTPLTGYEGRIRANRTHIYAKAETAKGGIQKAQAAKQNSKTRLPITPEIMRQLCTFWASKAQDPDTVMLWAVCCICFFWIF